MVWGHCANCELQGHYNGDRKESYLRLEGVEEDATFALIVCDRCSNEKHQEVVEKLFWSDVLSNHKDRECVRIWRFEKAHEAFQMLSTNGGDEDWVALIPPSMSEEYFGWMEEGSPFGCCDVSEYDLPWGWKVRIGSHA